MNDFELKKRMAANREELHRLQHHLAYIERLLNVSKWLTFLLYLAFCLSLYLGDILHLQSLLTSFIGSAPGFVFYAVVCLMLAYVLAGIKHAAYSHFALFGRVVLIIAVVVSMGLLAEVFQSSGNQDTKARAVAEASREYQVLVNHNPAEAVAANVGLVAALATAQQTLARCEEKLKQGKEKHCNGDRAKLEALQASQTATHQAQIQAATANTEAKFNRLDQLKKEGYNPTTRAISELSGLEVATAIVLVMLFISAQFECLHWWLSEMKARTLNQLRGIKGGMDRLEMDYFNLTGREPQGSTPAPTPAPATSSTPYPGGLPVNALYPSLPRFKWQDAAEAIAGEYAKAQAAREQLYRDAANTADRLTPTKPKADPKQGTHEQQLPLPELSTWNKELEQHGIHCPTDAVLNQAADKDSIRRIIEAGLQAGKPCVSTGTKPCVEPAEKPLCTGFTTTTQNRSDEVLPKTPSKPQAGGSESLYGEWVADVQARVCRPSVDATWRWIQKRISNQETGNRKPDL
ncbi:MAG: hypothetical protein R3E89_15640 [Thiolinea sp.]